MALAAGRARLWNENDMSDVYTSDTFDTDIAVVGMAGRFPGARNIGEYWANLRAGVESLTTFTDEELLAAGVSPAMLNNPNYVKRGAVLPDMEMFDAPFFGFSPREASIMDPQHRHFLECAWEALENAGHVPGRFPGAIGVFGGSGHNAYMPYNLLTNPKLMQAVGFFLVRHTGNDKDFLTTRVSYLLNLKGPSVNVQTACSTSLVAIHTGVQSLLNRECDMALAGGVTIELPHRHGYLYHEGEILSPDGHCHAFDADSKGTVFGSAVGVVVLRRLADAIESGDHIHAVIKGSAINNDGSGKMGYLAPSVDGQAQAIAEALALANVSPDTISYVETHGTGTPVGDPIEIAALSQAFRQGTDARGFCGVGSVKSNIGHTDTAAGVASFIKVAMAMQHRELPASLHFKSPNPACEFERSPFYVNAALKPWTPPAGAPRRAGVSSLGVGGTNAHIILEEAPPRAPGGPSREHQVLLLSAKTATALDANAKALAEHFAQHPDLSLPDAAYTLQVGREPMAHRRVLVSSSVADAAQALANPDPKRVFTETAPEGGRTVAFMFAGGGAQYPTMGAGLYATEPVFRQAVDECLALLARHEKADFKSLLFPPAGQEAAAAQALERPSMALPCLLTVQYAQAKLWMSWGLQPSAMIGHSMGEYTAAHLAGVFSLEDALRLVALRGRLFETLPEGGMLSVPLPEAELQALMPPELSIAALNGPQLSVASGPVAAIDALQQKLAAQEIDAARVRISVAAHSSMLEPILQEFGAFFQRISMKAPTLPLISNVTGTWMTAEQATDPQYWVQHLRRTVRFADGLKTLLEDTSRVLLEVGPGRTLASLSRQHPARAADQPVLNSLRHPDEQVHDQAFVLGVLGRLWAVGAPVDWDAVRGDEKRLRVPLPTYRFDHQRHWVEPGQSLTLAPEPTLDKRADLTQWFYQPSWQQRELPRQAAAEGAAAQAMAEAGAEPAVRSVWVMADDSPLCARLIKRLRDDGALLTVVRPGKAYVRRGDEFTLQPEQPGQFDRLLGTLSAEGRAPQDLYHFWTLTGHKPLDPGLRGIEEMRRLGFDSLVHLAQAIGREDLGEPMRWCVVTDHLQRVAGETQLQPAKATLLGPCKVIPREFANIRCHCIDLQLPPPGSVRERQLIERLLAEPSAAPDEDVVAYRGMERWVLTYAPAPLEPVATPRAGLRPKGTYLITGGLGGVGLALAGHLAASVQARLVLVGRSPLPDRKDWAAWLPANPGHPNAARIRQVMALEAQGAEVLVAAADVADLGQMKSVIKQARARFGAIHGVLHTAGVLNDGVIQLKDDAAVSAVWAPKVQGTVVLEAALSAVQADAPLDFMVLFSSISAFAGLAGQVDYASANAFLDAYAQDRLMRDGTHTVAVNWSQWQEVGMAAALAQQLGLAPAPQQPVGHPLVANCVKDAPQEREYSTHFSTATHWLLDEHRIKGGEALIPGTGYLELVRAAFAHHPPAAATQAIELRDVTFLSPFVVHGGEDKELRVQFRRAAEGEPLHFIVMGRQPGEVEDWVENVRGEAAYVTVARPAEAPLAEIAERCRGRAQVFDGTEKPAHLDFGPRWSNLRRIDFGQGEALARLSLPQPFEADLAQFKLHPAMMDMATAGAQSLIPGFDEGRDFFVPASYGRVRILADLPAHILSHIRYRGDNASNGELAVYDITVMDEQGRVLVDIEEFTMIRVRDKALLGGEAAAAAPVHHVTPAARPKAVANELLAVGLSQGILTREGMEVLDRIIAAGAGPQVVVSAQDLKAVLAPLHAPAGGAAKADAAAEGAVDDPDWVAPSTATEILIAEMWGDMLGVARVSAKANFFDLGGHSLLALQVINKLKKRTGKTLPLTALLEAPTVEGLAGLIEPKPAPGEEGATAASGSTAGTGAAKAPAVRTLSKTLITIRPAPQGVAQPRPPLFFVHDGNGETLLYRTLALMLRHDQAVYGLQPEMRPDGSVVHTTIPAMAAAHIAQIRQVQPHGPYFLTGLCAGGVIAFEMARQLEDAGEATQFVGIIDAGDVEAEERRFRVAGERLNRLLGSLTEDTGEPIVVRLGKAIPKILRKTSNLARYEIGSRIDQFRNARKVQQLREQGQEAPEAADQAEQDTPDITYLKVYEYAHKEHRPQGVFRSGDVVVFRALKGDGSVGDMPYIEKFVDPLLGWQVRVATPVVGEDIPGGHSSLLQEPNVRVLAEKMQRHLDAAMSRLAAAAQAAAPSTAASPAQSSHDATPVA